MMTNESIEEIRPRLWEASDCIWSGGGGRQWVREGLNMVGDGWDVGTESWYTFPSRFPRYQSIPMTGLGDGDGPLPFLGNL